LIARLETFYGISWDNEGTQLCAFSLEGKQWILKISDSGISINKNQYGTLEEKYRRSVKDAFRKVVADEKDSENENGLDGNWDGITNEDDTDFWRPHPACRLWDLLEYADFEQHFEESDNIFEHLVKTCEPAILK
ncbi:4191_t:CDS:2, partial [Paraglomus occultum]